MNPFGAFTAAKLDVAAVVEQLLGGAASTGALEGRCGWTRSVAAARSLGDVAVVFGMALSLGSTGRGAGALTAAKDGKAVAVVPGGGLVNERLDSGVGDDGWRLS